jgi:hypothetical protein
VATSIDHGRLDVRQSVAQVVGDGRPEDALAADTILAS